MRDALNLFELTERRSWQGRSDGAEAIGGALFPLFTRDFAPVGERMASISARLEAAPRYLAETQERVERPVVWTEIDIQSGETLPEFLDTILEAARAQDVPGATVDRLERAIAGTNAALDEHQAWLRDDVMPRSDHDWLAGPEQFEEMVRPSSAGGEWRRDPGRRRGDAGPGPRAAERGLHRDRPCRVT